MGMMVALVMVKRYYLGVVYGRRFPGGSVVRETWSSWRAGEMISWGSIRRVGTSTEAGIFVSLISRDKARFYVFWGGVIK